MSIKSLISLEYFSFIPMLFSSLYLESAVFVDSSWARRSAFSLSRACILARTDAMSAGVVTPGEPWVSPP
jgi:hypothetical protein